MEKKIGIVSWSLGQNSMGVTLPYIHLFQAFGEVVLLAPNSNEVVEGLDLLVLPGGADVDTKRYGEAPSVYTGKSNDMLEWFDANLLPKYIEMGTPIFAICRGMQSLNVHFGGNLYQDIGWTGHETSTKSRSELVNTLEFNHRFNDYKCGQKKYEVNSIHHQAVKDLGEGLEVVAYCKEWVNKKPVEIVEIFTHQELPIWGFQYHPEEIWDDAALKVISELLEKQVVYE